MIQHVAPLVDLTTLDQSRLSRMRLDRRRERLRAIQDVQPCRAEIEPSFGQISQQLAHYRGVLGASLPETQDSFAPVLADAQPCHHLLTLKRRRIGQQPADPLLSSA